MAPGASGKVTSQIEPVVFVIGLHVPHHPLNDPFTNTPFAVLPPYCAISTRNVTL